MIAGGALAFGANNVNAATKVDNNHVQVEAGDTLSQIAKENNMDVDQLAQINHIQNKDLIHVGDKLVITPSATTENNNQVNTVNTSANTNSSNVQSGNGNVSSTSSVDSSSSAEAIAQAESGGSYTAQNGRYYGRYQLDMSYLGGDLSPQHQDEVFQQYCNQRYGGVDQALAFRQSHGWY